MTVWNPELYIRAWNFAAEIHKGQYLPGSDIPYLNHIGLVVMEGAGAIASGGSISQPDLLIACAVLHDAIEDTETTYDEVANLFGKQIADGVLALTKDLRLPTKEEQMQDSITRIREQPSEIWMVKLCDRIANLQSPPLHWGKQKIIKYREEAGYILARLGPANDYLAQRLKVKMKEYGTFVG